MFPFAIRVLVASTSLMRSAGVLVAVTVGVLVGTAETEAAHKRLMAELSSGRRRREQCFMREGSASDTEELQIDPGFGPNLG